MPDPQSLERPLADRGASAVAAADPRGIAERLGRSSLLQNATMRKSDRLRRLMIGICGVAAVLLLIGLASLIGDRRADDLSAAATTADTAGDGASEPLAEFGVQPAAPTTSEKARVPAVAPPDAAPAGVSPSAPAAKAVTVPDLEPEPRSTKSQ